MKLAHEVTLAIHGFCEGGEVDLPSPIVVSEAGVIRPGFAVDQIQVCSLPAKETTTLLQSLVTLDNVLYEKGIGFPVYRPCRYLEFVGEESPMGPLYAPDDAEVASAHSEPGRKLRVGCWEHPHTQSLIKPLYAPDEFAEEASQLIRLADFGFTTVDFDVTEFKPEAQLLRLNLLNLVGPAALDHLYRRRYIQRNDDKRHEIWRYAVNQARVPQGWTWQKDPASYLREVVPLTKIFAYTQERVDEQYVFADGLFHYATLVASGGRTLIRFSALPAFSPALTIHFVEMIDRWLVRAVRAVGTQKSATAVEAASLVRFFDRPIPVAPSVRLYVSER